MLAMITLDGFDFYRLLSVPRPPEQPGQPDPTPAQLFAALAAAHAQLGSDHTQAPAIAVAWQRSPGQHHMQVIVGGRPFFPPVGPHQHTNGHDCAVLYPPGSVGQALDPDQVIHELAAYTVWLRCPGHNDPLWTAHTPHSGNKGPQRGGFDDYVAHLAEPFAWLVVAEPLPPTAVDDQLKALAIQIPSLRQRENSESHRVKLERTQGRYRERSRARTSGMWNLHVLVGATTTATARRAAALLCSSSDLAELPYMLLPGSAPGSWEQATTEVITSTDGPCSPFPATTELLAALARPPRRELPGIRMVERADFDLTPEHHGTIPIGDILNEADQPVGTFSITTATLNRHTFITGATGAGKSQTVRHILEQLHHTHIPWLVIEPAKAEYARMAGRIGGEHITVIRPGDPDAIPVGLNPLEPEPRFPLQTHIDLVRALFLAAFEALEPFPQVLAQALTRCYSDLGWNLVLGDSGLNNVTPKYPSLADLQHTALDVVENIGYSKDITNDVRGFIDVRLSSLRQGTPGRFFEGGHPLDIADLLRRNVVLEIEDIGNDQDKAFFIGAVLIRIYEHLRIHHATKDPSQLRHITVVEEAHRLLKRVEPGTPAAHAVELFTALLAEIRAYGEGLIIAEQIPAKIAPDVIKNTALKIIHRLPAADDRDTVGATMNLNQTQSRHVVSLPPGHAAVFTDGMDRPLRITIPLGERREDATHAGRTVGITRARSAACGSACRTRACTLRQADHAQRLAENPEFVLWIELLTIAHLVGRPAPQPEKTWRDNLKNDIDQRTLECAIAHRIQVAIDSRYTGLAAYYQPEHLATHLACAALAHLDAAAPPCDGSEIRWQAGQYRWIDVLHALDSDNTDKDQPHPDTATWAHRGLRLTGHTQTEQLQQLLQHRDLWQPPNTIITGIPTPPAQDTMIQTVIDHLSTAADPCSRYQNATSFLQLTNGWPLSVLNIPDSSQAGEQT